MKLKRLEIANFRNILNIHYQPGPGLNILQGDNGQGKTNIIESIYVLATGNSFRTNIDKNLVNYDKDSFHIQGCYTCKERKIESNLQYNISNGKKYTINSKKTTHRHYDRLRVVLFTPDDLSLIKGAPGKRRNFIDVLLKQIFKEYYSDFVSYTKILKKRNLLLKKEQTNSTSFEIINQLFIENAARIIMARIKLINVLDEKAAAVYNKLNDEDIILKIRYALSFPIDSDKIDANVLKEALKKQINLKHEDEIKQKNTLIGPHLDDINIYQNGKIARYFASQGQQRNIVVAIKLAEMITFNTISDFYPVFLLDEVLSELDNKKQYLLLDYLNEAEFQSFLTSVRLKDIKKNNAVIIYTVINGKLQ
ncbi:MAG: DNA replication/repair protein RecF [Syntrophomonadaceae bacterium]